MVMSVDNPLLKHQESIALIADRTLTPNKVLGQGCLISKNKLVTCASSVFNYIEAPWALCVTLPDADLNLGVKSITLHPDFDKRAARIAYLSQNSTAGQTVLTLPNNLATLLLDPTLPELNPEKLVELNGFLSLSLPLTGQEISGPVRGDDLPTILQNALYSQKEGVLTLMDTRNIPYARLAIKPGLLPKILYRCLSGELALFELVYRREPGSFLFQPPAAYAWPNLREVTSSAEMLIKEAVRRAQELPQLRSALGGSEARWERATSEYDLTAISPSLQWVADRLWSNLDGYISLDRLWERVGADSYTTHQAMQELVNLGVLFNNQGRVYRRTGQMGIPLIPAFDLQLQPEDQITALWLDPASGHPVVQEGKYLGAIAPDSPMDALINIPLPAMASGAMLIKDNRLVGIYTAPSGPLAGTPHATASRMMKINALSDMGARRFRSQIEAGDTHPLDEDSDSASTQKMDTSQVSRLGRFICPACQTVNIQNGLCHNCGCAIGSEPSEIPSTKTRAKMNASWSLTRVQKLAIAVVLLAFSAFLMFLPQEKSHVSLPPPPEVTAGAPTKIFAELTEMPLQDSEKAVQIAAQYAGFTGKAPPTYKYLDTSAVTGGQPSFGLVSQRQNQLVMFVVWDNINPIHDLNLLLAKLPFCNYDAVQHPETIKVDQGEEPMPTGEDDRFIWFVGRFPRGGVKDVDMVLVGAYPAPQPGKAIVLLARGFSGGVNFDYKTSLWLANTMMAQGLATGHGDNMSTDDHSTTGKGDATPEASPADLESYRQKIATLINAAYHPDRAKEKITILVGLTPEGKLSKLEITNPSGIAEADQALLRAIEAVQPYPQPPHTNAGGLSVKIMSEAGKVHISAP